MTTIPVFLLYTTYERAGSTESAIFCRILSVLPQNVSKIALQKAWRKIEALATLGKTKSIGVSNTTWDDLTDVVRYAKVPVSAVQNVFDPFRQDKEVNFYQPYL